MLKAARIATGKGGLLLFGILILGIAGIYLGSYVLYLFYILLFYALFALLQLLVSIGRIRLYQEFSTNHPVKGEEIDYRIHLANESLLPSCLLLIRFRTTHPGADPILPAVERILLPGKRLAMKARIRCPYRGVYRVGVETLELVDLFGIITYKKSLPGRTFYVLPRVLALAGPFFSLHRRLLSTESADPAGDEDFARFKGLRPYRAGESVRHLDWKRFSAQGATAVREYSSGSARGVTIYLDLRPVPPDRSSVYEVEDCVMEVLVSLCARFLADSVPVRIRAAGREPWDTRLESTADFPAFHRRTALLPFDGSVAPAALDLDETRTRLFLTHREDGGVLELVESSRDLRDRAAAVLITAGMTPRTRQGAEGYLKGLAERGFLVRAVEKSAELSAGGERGEG